MPHLVLPLSGCLSRRTPTRATRGEARGHRSVLSQKPLLMYPLLFAFFGLVVGLVCPRHMAGWSQCVCAAVAAFLPGFDRWRYVVDMWVAEGHTHDGHGSLCCLCIASRCGCRPASGLLTQSRCRALVHRRCQWCRDRLGHNGLARLCVCVWQSRSSGPQWLSPRVGRLGDNCSVRSCPLVYLCRCGYRRLRPEGWYSMATHPSDS